jgi:hypothetical protein
MSILASIGWSRRALGLVALLVLLALGNLALLPAPLAAVAGSGCKGTNTSTFYFSDASHTTLVGSYHSNCQGVCTGSGQITGFFEIATTNVICGPRGGVD